MFINICNIKQCYLNELNMNDGLTYNEYIKKYNRNYLWEDDIKKYPCGHYCLTYNNINILITRNMFGHYWIYIKLKSCYYKILQNINNIIYNNEIYYKNNTWIGFNFIIESIKYTIEKSKIYRF